jgi:CRISPR/Cas system-associated endoribonuclease Cas2
MHHLLLLIFLFTNFCIYGQIDQKKIDSLELSIDSSTKAQKTWQDSFAKVQDSIYRSAVNNSDSTKLSAEQKTKVKGRQKIILRFAIIAVLLVTTIIVILRRKQKKT